ncbi:hypothetical protein KI387_042411, partial [Taxus chinensis]
KHKFEGNSDFSLYGLLTHGSMREPKEVRAKGNNYDKLAAVHMATKEENDGSIFQFYDPMMRPVVPKFSAYVNQISVLTLFMELLFFVKFQSGSCYTMIIGLNLQKSDLGLPLAAMNNNVFSFFECIPSWNNEKGRFQLNGGIKSDYDVLFSDLYILIFERKMHEYSCLWDNTIEVNGKPNVVADALSRMPSPTSLEDVELQSEGNEEYGAADTLGLQLLGDKQFWEGRTVMSLFPT